MNKTKGSPRKFSEKIALLNKKEAEANAEFERIIKEVEETTRYSPQSQQAILYSTSNNINATNPTTTTTTRWLSGPPNNESIHASYSGSFDLDQSSSSNCFDQPISGYYNSTDNVQINQHGHHLSVETPPNVPNINIFPIDDDDIQQISDEHQHLIQHNQQLTKEQHFHHNNQQQQVPVATIAHNSGYKSLDCSNYNQISSARSLPDIANLRVSSSTICSSGLAPSYSDQRINSLTEQNYNNYNNDNSYSHQQQQFCDNAHNAPTTTTSTNHQNTQQLSSWQHIDNNSQHHTIQHDQQQFPCSQQSHDNNNTGTRFLHRANSTNPVLCASWNNNDDSTFNHPPSLQYHKQTKSTNLNSNLSKSSEFCYSYSPSIATSLIDNNNHITNNNCFSNNNQFDNNQLPLPAYRERSSSYNNIDTIRNDLKTARYAQQQLQFQHSVPNDSHQNLLQQEQQQYVDNSSYQYYDFEDN